MGCLSTSFFMQLNCEKLIQRTNCLQAFQHGWIGLNIYTLWFSPFSNSKADVKATKRAKDFMLGG